MTLTPPSVLPFSLLVIIFSNKICIYALKILAIFFNHMLCSSFWPNSNFCTLSILRRLLLWWGFTRENSSLRMRLAVAVTDARIWVASQEKLHVKLLEDQLESLYKVLSKRSCTLEKCTWYLSLSLIIIIFWD